MRHLNLVNDLVKDLAYGARTLRNAPTFTTTVLLTIALGIGACTAIFSVVNAVLLRPLPYKNPGRLVLADAPVSNAYFFDLRDGTGAAFDDLAAIMVFRAIVPREDGTAERIGKGLITTNFFHMLGAQIVFGRDFTEDHRTAVVRATTRDTCSRLRCSHLSGSPASRAIFSLKPSREARICRSERRRA